MNRVVTIGIIMICVGSACGCGVYPFFLPVSVNLDLSGFHDFEFNENPFVDLSEGSLLTAAIHSDETGQYVVAARFAERCSFEDPGVLVCEDAAGPCLCSSEEHQRTLTTEEAQEVKDVFSHVRVDFVFTQLLACADTFAPALAIWDDVFAVNAGGCSFVFASLSEDQIARIRLLIERLLADL